MISSYLKTYIKTVKKVLNLKDGCKIIKTLNTEQNITGSKGIWTLDLLLTRQTLYLSLSKHKM